MRYNIYILSSILILCLLVLTSCKTYTSVYDDCIERLPEFQLYCDCIAVYSDGLVSKPDEAYDECKGLIPEDEMAMCEVKVYEG